MFWKYRNKVHEENEFWNMEAQKKGTCNMNVQKKRTCKGHFFSVHIVTVEDVEITSTRNMEYEGIETENM